jgi:hypothetical protein
MQMLLQVIFAIFLQMKHFMLDGNCLDLGFRVDCEIVQLCGIWHCWLFVI